MKLKFTILLISLSISIHAQTKLKGIYLSGPGFSVWSLNFKNHSEFVYYFSSCTGGNEGGGNYIITGDSLHLLFKNSSKYISKKEMFTDSIYSCTKNDSIKINITIGDDIEALAFATIKIGNKVCTSDIDGKAEITIAKDTGLVQVDARSVGYKSVRFWLKPNECRNLKIYLDNNFIKPIEEGTVYDYKIRINSKSHIVLKQNDYEINLYKKEQQ